MEQITFTLVILTIVVLLIGYRLYARSLREGYSLYPPVSDVYNRDWSEVVRTNEHRFDPIPRAIFGEKPHVNQKLVKRYDE
jgi:hypothetical protein